MLSPEIAPQTPMMLLSSPDPLGSINLESPTNLISSNTSKPSYLEAAKAAATIPQKRIADTSIITPERLRMPSAREFQFSTQILSTNLPKAQTAKEAISIARNMVLQASTLAKTSEEQSNLLDLLEVFRNYTETGRARKQQELPAQSKRTYAEAAKPTKSKQQNEARATSTQTQQREQIRLTASQQRKKDLQKRQIILSTEDERKAEAICPLAQRNAINNALKQQASSKPVIASVKLSAKKNIILTTTEDFTADFLLKHAESWKLAMQAPCTKVQKQENWAQVVAHGVYMHDSFLASTANLKEEIETFNNITIKGNPRWLLKREKREIAHTLPQAQRYASIVFAVESEEERQKLLRKRQISVAGRVVYLQKFQDITPKTQCYSCYKLGHNSEMCRSRGCKFCNEPHFTKDHASCTECKLIGRRCRHQKLCCRNCQKEHVATNKDCSYLQENTSTRL